MRRVLVLLVLFAWPVPTEAAWSFISARGNATNTSAQATVTLNPSAAIAVGRIALVVCSMHNTVTTSTGDSTLQTVTDTHTHTWTRLREISRSGTDDITLGLWMTKITTQIETTDTITCDSGEAASLGKRISAAEFAVDSGKTFDLASSGWAHAIATTVTVTGVDDAPLSSVERMWIGVTGVRSLSGTISIDAAYTSAIVSGCANTGSDITGACSSSGYLVATQTDDSYTGGHGSASRATVAILVALDEISDGSASTACRNLLLLGVGGSCS
jgi:hypothetical protein